MMDIIVPRNIATQEHIRVILCLTTITIKICIY